MNKIIILITLVIIGVIAYILTQPRRSAPVVKIPDVIAQPTEAPSSLPDSSTVKKVDTVVGQGDEAVKGKKVSVQYKGSLEDGTVFDSSAVHNNEPLTFEVGAGQMIPGFDTGVVGMKVGGTRTITIPPELGYGSQGAGGGKIPPNATLIFEVTLEKVE
ncbi:MAG: FKBP-type peptidyl-prolyl cis-trans isomerase [Candidatus Roizmanbacteria bacterium]